MHRNSCYAMLIVGIVAALLPVPAAGQPEPSINWRSIRQRQWVCREWGGCGWEYRWRRVQIEPRYYAAPRRDWDEERWERRDPASERGVQCKDNLVRVVGEAHLTQDGALNAAVRQWSATVRYDAGEKFMSIENARAYRWRCDRASTNESTAGKIGEALSGGSAYQRRCVVQAIPCLVPTIRGDKDDR